MKSWSHSFKIKNVLGSPRKIIASLILFQSLAFTIHHPYRNVGITYMYFQQREENFTHIFSTLPLLLSPQNVEIMMYNLGNSKSAQKCLLVIYQSRTDAEHSYCHITMSQKLLLHGLISYLMSFNVEQNSEIWTSHMAELPCHRTEHHNWLHSRGVTFGKPQQK